MNKKAIAILGAIFILIVGTLGFLIYSKYKGNTSTPNSTTTTAGTTNPTPIPSPTQAANGSNIVQLTTDQVLSPTLFYNGNGITYFDKQGNLYQASLQDNNGVLQFSSKKSLNIEAKPNISKILWPSKGDDFIAQKVDSTGKKTWSFYSSSQGVYTDLPASIYSLDWMPNSTQIFYVWSYADKNDTVNIADSNGKNYKKIGDIYDKNAVVSVSPDGLNILYYKDGNTGVINPVVLTTPDGKIWKTLVNSGYNYGILWSPDSQKFLFGKKDPNSQKYQLWYYNLLSSEVKNLGLFTTVEKALWAKDSQNIYAAVPTTGSIQDGSLTVDSFFKMDTSTLEKKEYQNENPKIDGRDMFLSLTGDKLFFRNAQDGGLYYLNLSQ